MRPNNMIVSYMLTPALPKDTFKRDVNLKKNKILDIVCSYFRVNMKQLVGKRRKREIVLPRQIAIVMLRKYTDMGINKIGDVFDRDHTTCIAATKAISDQCFSNPIIRDYVREIENKILS